jgi:predicted aspartyl protease
VAHREQADADSVSGAVYSVLRQADWKAMRLRPERTMEFVLADGTTLIRSVSECAFELQGSRATSPVVLGETEDEALLGAVTLETLGLVLNPLTRKLQPMRMMLAQCHVITSMMCEPDATVRPKSEDHGIASLKDAPATVSFAIGRYANTCSV